MTNELTSDPDRPVDQSHHVVAGITKDSTARGSSPMASGPAGAQLEAHVGAQYLLPLLLSGEPRGRPGMTVSRVQFQRGDLGFPMDDVIVSGHDASGATAVLEIQVKRSIEFTPKNNEFRRVIAMACKAAALNKTDTQSHTVAVAIGTSARSERYVQATLQWARQYQGCTEFFRRLNLAGAADQEMREFVFAFRSHMQAAGASDDDHSTWQLLRRFLVLTFDVEQPGSASAILARDRCAALLVPQQASRASELWDTLGQIALELDAQGGDIDAIELRRRLTQERSFLLYGDRRLRAARERIAEDARFALAAITTEVQGVHLDREEQVRSALTAMETGRYLELRGESGVGKSGVLKALASRATIESRVLVLAPYRIVAGGWGAMRDQLRCDARAEEFLADLAGDGGATLFIDGVDRIDNPGERATVVDLMRSAAGIPGFRVIATARMDFEAEASAWLPQDAIQLLGQAPRVVIEELSQTEKGLLRSENTALAALLRPGHPAEKLVGNPYRLDRLARTGATQGGEPYSEAQMAYQWWETGDSVASARRLERRRLLHDMATHSLVSSSPFDTHACSSDVLAELTASGTLRSVRLDVHEFTHDVLRDWAIACLLYDEPNRLERLDRSQPIPVYLSRAIDIAARLCGERHQNSSRWRAFLEKVDRSPVHGSWRRAALLSIARSERFVELFARLEQELFDQQGALFSELLRVAVAVDSRPAQQWWVAMGVDPQHIPAGMLIPSGMSWYHLTIWCITNGSRLPDGVVPDAIDLLGRWCAGFLGKDSLSREIVTLFHTWLLQSEAKRALKYRNFRPDAIPPEPPGPSLSRSVEETLRQQFLLWSFLQPQLAANYLEWVGKLKHNQEAFGQLIKMPGSAPRAAPKATADLFLKCLPEHDKEDYDDHRRESFSHWDLQYFPASPARAPFLEVLNADATEGLRLIRGVVSYALNRAGRGKKPSPESLLRVELPQGARTFSWPATYLWSRQAPSSAVTSALMALEAWGHQRIERGDAIDAVANDVLGPEGGPAAYLLVALDVLLSHLPASRDTLWRFAMSAELLALDRERLGYDTLNRSTSLSGIHAEPKSSVTFASLQQRASRQIPLDEILDDLGRTGSQELRATMRASLSQQIKALGAPEDDCRAFADPKFAAWSAFNRLDPSNHVQTGVDKNGDPELEYVPPSDEADFLANLQLKANRGQQDTALHLYLSVALRGDRVVNNLTLEGALQWASSPSPAGADEAEIQSTRWMLAAILMRDGSATLKSLYWGWAREHLADAARQESDKLGVARDIPFNPAAIAAVGYLAGFQSGELRGDLSLLLRLTADDRTNMASVLTVELNAGRPIEMPLARSIVRLGFVSEIYAVARSLPLSFNGDWRVEQKRLDDERFRVHKSRREQAVAAELAWLLGTADEPQWPKLPTPRPPRRRFRMAADNAIHQPRRNEQDFDFDSAGASRWLSIAAQLWGQTEPERLQGLLQHCWQWTAAANGVGAQPDEEAGERALEWNNAFFSVSVQVSAVLSDAHWEQLVLGPLSQLQDKAFFDSAAAALFQLDLLWIDQGRIEDAKVLAIRARIADMLRNTRAWTWLIGQPTNGTEIGLGELIAKLFVGQNELGKGPRSYLPSSAVERRTVLMELLTPLACDAAASTFTALAFVSLMLVGANGRDIAFMDRTTAAWWRFHGARTQFWVDYGIGNCVFMWCEALDDDALKTESCGHAVLRIADILLKCGIPEGSRLEERVRRLGAMN